MTQKERSRRWYLKHREEQKARTASYDREHREARKHTKKVYYERHRSRLMQLSREHYRAHRDQYTRWRLKKYWEYRALVDEVKTSRGCAECGLKGPPVVLEFHHKERSKEKKAIAKLIRFKSKEDLLREIEKCTVLCANHHRILHWDEKHPR